MYYEVKMLITTAANDFFLFCFVFLGARQTIHMKCQVLFSQEAINLFIYVFRTSSAIVLLNNLKVQSSNELLFLCSPFLSINSEFLGPVVQSVVSLTRSLRVILLTVLADSIHNILIFFAEKNATHIFSAKNFSIFAYHSM